MKSNSELALRLSYKPYTPSDSAGNVPSRLYSTIYSITTIKKKVRFRDLLKVNIPLYTLIHLRPLLKNKVLKHLKLLPFRNLYVIPSQKSDLGEEMKI